MLYTDEPTPPYSLTYLTDEEDKEHKEYDLVLKLPKLGFIVKGNKLNIGDKYKIELFDYDLLNSEQPLSYLKRCFTESELEIEDSSLSLIETKVRAHYLKFLENASEELEELIQKILYQS